MRKKFVAVVFFPRVVCAVFKLEWKKMRELALKLGLVKVRLAFMVCAFDFCMASLFEMPHIFFERK